MASRSPVRIRAFAKINVSLRVVGVRADGYHELRTVFQSIALHDTLVIGEMRGPLQVICDDPACPADRTNLVWQAADYLWRASGRRGRARDVAINLAKRIPMQVGLGGGSSDAAAALVALARLWRVDTPVVENAARALGADVAYFLHGGTMLGLDRGDLLYPLADRPNAWVTLVVPPFGVSTRDAYRWWDASHAGASRASGSRDEFTNDLQSLVVRRYPQVGRLVRALERAGASQAAMSGSGSAVFGLFGQRADAERAGRTVSRDPSGKRCKIVITRTLNRPAYQRLAGITAHRIHLPFAPRGLGHI